MAHPHGLQVLVGQVNSVALTTLGARSALLIESTLQDLTATFLLKRVRYWLKISGVTADEGPLLVGVANGDAALSEINTSMIVTNTSGPLDRTAMLTQDDAWTVVRDSIRMMINRHSDTEKYLEGEWISMPKKGIPMPEGAGIQAFVFNAQDAALTTGSVIEGLIEYQGVWLRD